MQCLLRCTTAHFDHTVHLHYANNENWPLLCQHEKDGICNRKTLFSVSSDMNSSLTILKRGQCRIFGSPVSCMEGTSLKNRPRDNTFWKLSCFSPVCLRQFQTVPQTTSRHVRNVPRSTCFTTYPKTWRPHKVIHWHHRQINRMQTNYEHYLLHPTIKAFINTENSR